MRLHRLLAVLAALLAVAHLVGSAYANPLLPAAQALAWFAAAGTALILPGLPPLVRSGLAVAALAVGLLALPTAGQPQFGWVALTPVDGSGSTEPWRWLPSAVAGVALTVAVLALPGRPVDRRRVVGAATLAVLAGLLLATRGSAPFLPPSVLPPEPIDVLPAYLVLVALALVALLRSGAVLVATGLTVAAVAALGVVHRGWPPLPGLADQSGLTFYSAEEYQVRAAVGGAGADLLRFVAAALLLAGCRWAGRTRARGAARPGS
ncbi:hypothetical protein [Micromonospora auratinigra]|uniref:Uncharacterized protein n=1 Tax=Micromonospora auratinigra TaxID=261654 RepID=A0A1A9A940_9ACTN|nr:hypothetical protein [Micromonospora auratinigra]SBT52628.1 hypothetical protein GA0070611_5714 [Micromonospora auratinigra]